MLDLVSHADALNVHIGNRRGKRRTDHEREKETEEENAEWEEEKAEKEEEEKHEGTAKKEHHDVLDRSDDGKEAAVLRSEEGEEKDLEAEWEQRYRQKQLYLELLNDIELDVSSNATISDNTHNNSNTHNITEPVMEGQRAEVHGNMRHHKRKIIEDEDSEEISSSQETGQPGEIKEEAVVELSPTKRMKKEDGVPVVVVGCPQSSSS